MHASDQADGVPQMKHATGNPSRLANFATSTPRPQGHIGQGKAKLSIGKSGGMFDGMLRYTSRHKEQLRWQQARQR